MQSLKLVFVCSVLLAGAIGAFAQPLQWDWANSGGGADNETGNTIASDSNGNVFVAGNFQGTSVIGATTLTSAGGDEVFVAKLDAVGNWLWAKRAGGIGHDDCYGLCVDESGNAYIAGNFHNTAYFGALSLTAYGFNDVFVAKLDPAGNWLWAVRAGSWAEDYGSAICIDTEGNLRLTGSFDGAAYFGDTLIITSGGKDAYVACLDNSGNWLWARRAGGLNNDYGFAIACDSQGNTCVTGSFSGVAEFGSNSLTGQGPYDIYIANLDPTGNWLWAKRAGGEGSDEGLGVSIDGSGNIYLTGYFEGLAGFGSHSSVSFGHMDCCVAKLDASGNWLWARRAGGVSDDLGYSVSTDVGGTSHITGYFKENSAFGLTSLTSAGNDDIFAAGLDSNGNWLWAARAGGLDSDYAFSICRDTAENSFITGSFQSAASFGETTLNSTGNSDIYVSRLSAWTGVDDALAPEVSSQSWLSEAWPNPFRQGDIATIKAFIGDRDTGTLTIFNLRGQVISSQQLTSGEHQINLDNSNLSAGIYLYQLRTLSQTISKKLVLFK